MLDRLLSQGITLVILGLISAGCGGGLFLFFVAWNECLSAQWPSAMGHAIAAVATLFAVWWMCKHREELSDAW